MREVIKPMNATDMLDYALGRLEGPERDQAEREIADDPALAEILDRLGRGARTNCSTTATRRRRSNLPRAWP